jgi:hypothetical protein
MLEVDMGYLHMVEDFRLLECFILTIGNGTVPDDDWAFVDQLQRWVFHLLDR